MSSQFYEGKGGSVGSVLCVLGKKQHFFLKQLTSPPSLRLRGLCPGQVWPLLPQLLPPRRACPHPVSWSGVEENPGLPCLKDLQFSSEGSGIGNGNYILEERQFSELNL